ncbi:MAG: hypothetical protein ACK52I_14680 [Pseudomonadota bacterium]|jgi:hypothetical protein
MGKYRNDGANAFPSQYSLHPHGMTLRDYFAAASVPMIAATISFAMNNPGSISGSAVINEQLIAQMAYAYADAMLAERAK